MIIIKPLTTYTPEAAARIRALLKQLSRSGQDKGEIPAEWFEEIISSPSHVLLLAYQLPDNSSAPNAPGKLSPTPASATPSVSGAPVDPSATTVHGATAAPDPSSIVGMATLSLVMGPGIRKNAYLEDFVTDTSVRGQGVGSLLWSAMLDWAKEHHASRLEFTCGAGRETAQAFYEYHGAEKYQTNFYRIEVGKEKNKG